MSRAWLTPNELPNTLTCVRVFLPDAEAYRAALRGALVLLAQSWNWEKEGTQEPEDVAQLWIGANFETFKWGSCMNAGLIFWYPSDQIPDNLLVCDGSYYSVLEYPELNAVIGWNFGGTPPGLFAVPDLRDRFILGATTTAHVNQSGGETQHTLTTNEIPSHTHGIQATTAVFAPGAAPALVYNLLPLVSTRPTGGGEPHNNMPPYRMMIPVITTGT